MRTCSRGILSLVVCIRSGFLFPVHWNMVSIQAVAGLPWLQFPGTRPVIIDFFFVKCSCLKICPKQLSFLFITCCKSSGCSLNFSQMAKLVIFTAHGICKTCLALLLSAKCIFKSRQHSASFEVGSSQVLRKFYKFKFSITNLVANAFASVGYDFRPRSIQQQILLFSPLL